MRALTLWQPWASAIAIGAKRIETRSWATTYRGPLAIHAAKALPAEGREFREEILDHYVAHPELELRARHDAFTSLPLGAIVATCRLVEIYRLSQFDEDAISRGEILSLCPGRIYAADVTPEEALFGHYAAGRWAWVLADVKALTPPVPMPGARGLWEWRP